MYFNTLALAALATFGRVVLSAPAHEEANGYQETSRCYTKLGPRPVPYKTHYTTQYTKCTSTSTNTKTVITTLPSQTTTVTRTTTVDASTSTLTDTSTVVTTATETSTEVEVDTSTTSTVVSSTSTVPAPAGFLPIRTTLPEASYSGSGGPVSKRDALGDLDVGVVVGSDKDSDSSAIDAPPGTSPKQYPKEVECYKWTSGKCVKKVTTVKTTKTITPTGRVTSTTVETSTNYPSATTTITTTSTDTTTITTTSTTITTTTDSIPGPTVYAACGPDNFADNVAGTEIGDAGLVANEADLVVTGADSALDCCIAAFLAGNGASFVYIPSGSPDYNCYYDVPNTCPTQAANEAAAVLGDEGAGQVTIGNLQCAIVDQIS